MLGNVSELCLDCVTIDSYPVAETVEEAKIDYGGNEANVSGNVRARRGGCFGFVNGKGQEIGFDCRSAARKSQFSVACDDPNQGLRLCCPAGDAVSK
jgi:formylglycine-generating enzyme required for sulfatase activity